MSQNGASDVRVTINDQEFRFMEHSDGSDYSLYTRETSIRFDSMRLFGEELYFKREGKTGFVIKDKQEAEATAAVLRAHGVEA